MENKADEVEIRVELATLRSEVKTLSESVTRLTSAVESMRKFPVGTVLTAVVVGCGFFTGWMMLVVGPIKERGDDNARRLEIVMKETKTDLDWFYDTANRNFDYQHSLISVLLQHNLGQQPGPLPKMERRP